MRSAKKIWLIVAAALVVLGLLICTVVMSIFGWNFKKLSTAKYETNEHSVTDAFNNISIDTRTADIEFLPSDNDTCSVVCHEMVKAKHSVFVEDGTLKIKLNDERKWYDFLSIGFDSPKITVYMPAGEYGMLYINNRTGDINITGSFGFESIDILVSTGDVSCGASVAGCLSIETSTGNIRAENLYCGSAVLTATTGKINLSNLQIDGDLAVGVSTGNTVISSLSCNNFKSSGSTGNITLNSFIARGGMSVSRSTGNVQLNDCDASEIYITTDTGNVKGHLLSEKVFITNTDTGRVDVPKTVNGGRCEITTDTGNIEITVNLNNEQKPDSWFN